MKVKRLLVTLGSSFAFAAALVSCGFAQEGDSDYEEKIKTIDLSQYENSYWQNTKTDSWAGASRTFELESADAELSTGATYIPYYTGDNGTKVDIDASKIKGLNSITYDYYNRTTTTEAFSTFYNSINSRTAIEGGAPKEAGEYWVVANFHVDEDRYHTIKPWIAKINIYIQSPYSSSDITWNDAEGPASVGNPMEDALLDGVTLNYTQPGNKDVNGYTTITGLTGISGYKYEFHANSLSGTTLNSYLDVKNEGTYYAVLKLKAGNFYSLPTLKAGVSDGESYIKITLTGSEIVSEYTISYETEFETAPVSTSTTGTIATSNLPTLSHDGYVFEGWTWKTGPHAGELVVAGEVINENTVLVAKWSETPYHKISNKAGVLYNSDFNTATTIETYDDTATTHAAGLYQRRNEKTADSTVSPDLNKVVVENGEAKLLNGSQNYGTQLVYDFGTTYTTGVVEIAVDLDFATAFTKNQQPIQFFGTTNYEDTARGIAPVSTLGDIYGIRVLNENGMKFGYRLNGSSYNTTSTGVYPVSEHAAGVYTFYFIFDLDNHTITTTLNNEEWQVITGVTSLSQMRIATGDGNTETFAIDNLAIAYTDTAANSASFDATKLTTGDTYDASVADSTDIEEERAELTETELCDGFFTIVKNGDSTVVKRSGQKKVNDVTNYSSECSSIEFGTGAGLQFTVTDKVTFTVTVASTGGSNVSNFYLKDANDQYITGDAVSTTLQADESGNGYTTTGTGFMTITYTLEAGTYTFISSYNDGTKSRGGRVKTMVVAIAE